MTKAYQERKNRSKPFSKVETTITLEEAFIVYYKSIEYRNDTRNTWGRYIR